MIPLFTQEEFDSAKSRQKLPLQCKYCKKTFYRTKHDIQITIRSRTDRKEGSVNFCCQSCRSRYQYKEHQIDTFCDQCRKSFSRRKSQIEKSKHHFCSSSCAAKFHNTHKQKGTRRSKLETWLAEKLVALYPNLEFHFNRTDAIDAELDIFIPSLKLAFELNGVFHYEPVFGTDKLDRIQSNDERKILACAERGIGLCILDVSKVQYFKERTSQPFLDIIERIISQVLSPANLAG